MSVAVPLKLHRASSSNNRAVKEERFSAPVMIAVWTGMLAFCALFWAVALHLFLISL
ncbi:hypothetical protein NJB93_18920 [Brucella intermedia]|uniref:hypothetical protein n=1 Tax=Brucella intermedia TaxID=94625 RepID=UPI00209B59C9|nr:hypothetical protein [Brucella intermedia]MCO7728661.1 hypothetical protein [Brucella intermedia]